MPAKYPMFRCCAKIVLPVLLLLCGLPYAPAADVPLIWDPIVSASISGYNIYVGTNSRIYTTPITIGNQTNWTVTGLSSGTYYFAVTALDLNKNESGFSNEVSLIIGTASTTCNINGDGSVNALDLQALANVILGISPNSGNYDLNRDTRVDVLDLQILNNVVLGLRSCP